jgi:oxalate decarboxylase
MQSKYFFSLDAVKSKKISDSGSSLFATSDDAPGLVNISMSRLNLKKGGTQEPIWHPNAHKIGYCLQGEALVSLRTPKGVERFTIKVGDVFFIPQGCIHNIVQCNHEENTIAFAYNHSKPETMYLSQAIYSLSPAVFEATFALKPDFLDGLKKSKKENFLSTVAMQEKNSSAISSRFKFNIASSDKAVLTQGGYLQLATKTNLPVLEGLGILGFGLNPEGVVEPHWHTNAGELVYIVKGKTKITVLSPDGKTDVMEVSGGQGAFAPASYFHNIENIGSEDVEVIAFFNHAEPNYIGIGQAIGAYSNEVLGGVFNLSPSYFETLQKTDQPLVIVPV